ncbi:MAG TPA: GAF domain-containing protein, partial [Burkholderiaceae bacterium]|nr:GAF domain-containing protein [Burkholderiaceae bacterium]
MGSVRSAAELHRLLVDEAHGLVRAQRVLLIVDGPQGFQAAGWRLPRGESKAALLEAITPWLAEARRSGAASLRHGPQGAAPAHQRSCLIAPLNAERETFGYLYADVEGRVGRFDVTGRELIVLLARQAAVVLANLCARERLETELSERSKEALEQQRASAEVLSVIRNSVSDTGPVFE